MLGVIFINGDRLTIGQILAKSFKIGRRFLAPRMQMRGAVSAAIDAQSSAGGAV